MKEQQIETFNVIGIAMRTTNENGQAGVDIPALWNKFMSEGIMDKIPNKVTSDIYCIYTDYEKDHTKPYTTILGCKVSSVDNIPDAMISKTIEASPYQKFSPKGNIMQGLVYNEWIRIWNSGLPRTFTSDYEVYSDKSTNPENAEVDIYIAVE